MFLHTRYAIPLKQFPAKEIFAYKDHESAGLKIL